MICNVVVSIYNNTKVSLRCLDLLLINFDFINNFELLIINDGSDVSNSEEILSWFNKNKEIYNIKLFINSENKGVYYSWNLGIYNSICEYICIMHSDCYIPPKTINRLIECFNSKLFIDNNIKIAIPSSNSKYNISSDYLTMINTENYKSLYNLNKFDNSKYDLIILSDKYINIINSHANLVFNKFKDKFSILHSFPTYCFVFNKSFFNDYKFNENMFPIYYSEDLLFNSFIINNVMIGYCCGIYVYHLFESTIKYNKLNKEQLKSNNYSEYHYIIKEMNEKSLIL